MTAAQGTVQNAPPSAAPAKTAADELRELAGERRLSGRAGELNDLADALDNGTGLDRWKGVDLFSAFFQEDTVGRPVLAWLGRLLDIIVQALFFAPIAVTWLGLMAAAREYKKTLPKSANSGESFLQEWQSGFGGPVGGHLSKWFYLDRIAYEVVILVGALVAMMVVQAVYHARSDDDNPARLHRKLARALTMATLELAPHRVSAPEEAAAHLNQAAAEFGRTAAAIREVGEIASRTQTQAADGLTAVTGALGSVERATTAAGAAATGVGQAAQQMDSRLAELNSTARTVADGETEIARLVESAGRKIGTSVDGLATELRDKMAAAVRESSATIADAVTDSQAKMSTAIGESSATIAAAVSDGQAKMAAAGQESAGKVADALGAGSDRLTSALADITVVGSSYTHRVEQAADVLGQAGDAVNQIPAAVSGLRIGVADLASQVSSLGQAVTAATAALPAAADVPPDLRTALGDLRTAAATLQAASATLQTASATLQTTAKLQATVIGSSAGASSPPPRRRPLWRWRRR